jgi:hypothetical protein
MTLLCLSFDYVSFTGIEILIKSSSHGERHVAFQTSLFGLSPAYSRLHVLPSPSQHTCVNENVPKRYCLEERTGGHGHETMSPLDLPRKTLGGRLWMDGRLSILPIRTSSTHIDTLGSTLLNLHSGVRHDTVWIWILTKVVWSLVLNITDCTASQARTTVNSSFADAHHSQAQY